LLLVLFFIITLLGASSAGGASFPYLVYLSANALFPLMTLFLWLRLEEYRNYLPLYIAGKIITVVSFYAWEFLSSHELSETDYLVRTMVLLGGSVFISLADILSGWGAWTLKNKVLRNSLENGGV